MKAEKQESELKKQNQNPVPVLTSGIGTRITEASGLVGGKRRLSEMISLSEPQLHRVISGESQPKIETIAQIASACGVSLAWLATGQGPRSIDAGEIAPCDLDTVRLAVEAVEEGLAATERELAPARKADLVAAVYELLRDSEQKQESRGTILRLISSMA